MSETESNSLTPEDYLEIVSDAISDPTGNRNYESWVEGKTLTVMLGAPENRTFLKLRFVTVLGKPSAADMRGAPV
jgi:hypothetical protein